jgi:hypothetical protein
MMLVEKLKSISKSTLFINKNAEMKLGVAFCGQGQNRTGDTRLFRPLLYQLSYLSEFY